MVDPMPKLANWTVVMLRLRPVSDSAAQPVGIGLRRSRVDRDRGAGFSGAGPVGRAAMGVPS
ncbi:hypothetical protein GCM10007298_20420 [Williamsia phyllosphaerae]|uniref:Uncharacterized protein n=1 Tax=Williamsia phyllosphaerae TaxID=885042 RepID=A0ABQ1USL0_9NOCA|nr:hypothetical protein GCM10007298_20420 [Williamsia phyllosphaerae]